MSVKKIFVVDDDDFLRTIVEDHLHKNPLYVVETFSTGEDCIKKLSHKPDVVILDFELNSVVPDAKDGLTILQEIKKMDNDIVVIMLSSQTHYGKATQTIMKGAIEYVVKGDDAFDHIDKILSSLP